MRAGRTKARMMMRALRDMRVAARACASKRRRSNDDSMRTHAFLFTRLRGDAARRSDQSR
jgi:hypothetical protein